ncbi:hypothetical protein B0H14DRAFT_2574404 [Mycena olivaceomarginata]|nr:hypothetical protein B0H14DRAFT_2574404 [Mycena olivaceomarginata]
MFLSSRFSITYMRVERTVQRGQPVPTNIFESRGKRAEVIEPFLWQGPTTAEAERSEGCGGGTYEQIGAPIWRRRSPRADNRELIQTERALDESDSMLRKWVVVGAFDVQLKAAKATRHFADCLPKFRVFVNFAKTEMGDL